MKKIAIVTGSSRGIGKGIAKALIDHNYIVYLNGRTAETLEQTQSEFGKNAKIWLADLSNESEITKGIDSIFKSEGQIDVIVSNVGSGKAGLGWDVPLDDFKKMMNLNFFQSVNVCQTALKYMKSGHIILISSIAGVESVGWPLGYQAAKSALLSYMKSLSDAVASKGILVNAISPGFCLHAGGSWEERLRKDKEGVEKKVRDKVPLQKFLSPEDIAKGVLFLLQSPMVTGTNLIIDGGQIRRLV